ncbi:MAG: pirin family protein [Crocinitomicaceae bacterium]|nr:pirin family protein [Crocinitomicaceae bacterium]
MNTKKVWRTLPAQIIDMGGLPVKQALPTQNVANIDPFLLLHHGQIKPIFKRSANVQGVGPHPHRGFSPVTFVIEGEVHHRDSRGNSQIAKSGEVQWMHAGMGIIHSERPTENAIEKKMSQEMVQLWINSPASAKMKEPEYVHVNESDFPRIPTEDGLSDIKLISGNYSNENQSQLKGKINGESELLITWGVTKSEGKVSFIIPEGFNASLYIIRGDIRIEGHGLVDPESLVVFEIDAGSISFEAKSDAQYLLLAGEPINEKVVQQGPFVMNTETQILEAMRDYQMGKMGFLVEED